MTAEPINWRYIKLLLVIPVGLLGVIFGWGQIFALRQADQRAPQEARQRLMESKQREIENRRGEICFAEGDFEGARRAYEQSLYALQVRHGRNDPSCGAVLAYLGEIALSAGERETAKSHLAEAIRLLERVENPYAAQLEKARAKLHELGEAAPAPPTSREQGE